MKRSITLPKIKVDSFITMLVDESTSTIYHVYVNDEFYRAFNDRNDMIFAIELLFQNELRGI